MLSEKPQSQLAQQRCRQNPGAPAQHADCMHAARIHVKFKRRYTKSVIAVNVVYSIAVQPLSECVLELHFSRSAPGKTGKKKTSKSGLSRAICVK